MVASKLIGTITPISQKYISAMAQRILTVFILLNLIGCHNPLKKKLRQPIKLI